MMLYFSYTYKFRSAHAFLLVSEVFLQGLEHMLSMINGFILLFIRRVHQTEVFWWAQYWLRFDKTTLNFTRAKSIASTTCLEKSCLNNWHCVRSESWAMVCCSIRSWLLWHDTIHALRWWSVIPLPHYYHYCNVEAGWKPPAACWS